MLQVRNPIRIEPVGKAAHERGIVAPAESEREEVRGQGAQRE
jgi:hypothetical protein